MLTGQREQLLEDVYRRASVLRSRRRLRRLLVGGVVVVAGLVPVVVQTRADQEGETVVVAAEGDSVDGQAPEAGQDRNERAREARRRTSTTAGPSQGLPPPTPNSGATPEPGADSGTSPNPDSTTTESPPADNVPSSSSAGAPPAPPPSSRPYDSWGLGAELLERAPDVFGGLAFDAGGTLLVMTVSGGESTVVAVKDAFDRSQQSPSPPYRVVVVPNRLVRLEQLKDQLVSVSGELGDQGVLVTLVDVDEAGNLLLVGIDGDTVEGRRRVLEALGATSTEVRFVEQEVVPPT